MSFGGAQVKFPDPASSPAETRKSAKLVFTRSLAASNISCPIMYEVTENDSAAAAYKAEHTFMISQATPEFYDFEQ